MTSHAPLRQPLGRTTGATHGTSDIRMALSWSDAYDAAGGHCRLSPRSPNVQRELRPTSCTDGSLDRLVSSFVLVNHEQRKGTLGGTEDTDSRGTPSWVCIYRSNCLLTFVVCRSFLLFTVPRCVYLHLRRHTTKSSRSLSKYIQISNDISIYLQKDADTRKQGDVLLATMARPGFCHIVASVLLLAATILFIVATVSAPVVNSMGILVVRLPREVRGDTVTFGTFGHCVENGDK